MHIITGKAGYLMGHLLPHIPLDGYCYHFGCPIDSSCPRNRALLDQHLDDTLKIVKECRKKGLKLVYASSCEVVCPTGDTHYRTTKILAEAMMDPNKDLIWRIPRVYSIDRARGLIPQLKMGNMPRPDNVISWVHLDDFIEDFVSSLTTTGIRAYRGPVQFTKVKDIIRLLEERNRACNVLHQ